MLGFPNWPMGFPTKNDQHLGFFTWGENPPFKETPKSSTKSWLFPKLSGHGSPSDKKKNAVLGGEDKWTSKNQSSQNMTVNYLNWLVVEPTHLKKDARQIGKFPICRGEKKIFELPPTSNIISCWWFFYYTWKKKSACKKLWKLPLRTRKHVQKPLEMHWQYPWDPCIVDLPTCAINFSQM